MSVYADTNFITRLYLARPETPEAESIVAGHLGAFPVTWLLHLELINAFEQSVLTGYGEASRRISAQLAAGCQQQLRDDLRVGVFLRFVDVDSKAMGRMFEDIALRHTAKHGFRTYDIMHVSAAKVLKCKTFWSFDKRASKLAKLEGLKTL